MKVKATRYQWFEQEVLVCADEIDSAFVTLRNTSDLSHIATLAVSYFKEDARRLGTATVERNAKDEIESDAVEYESDSAVPSKIEQPVEQEDGELPCAECGRYKSALLSACECD